MSTKKKPQVDRATPRIAQPDKPDEMVVTGATNITNIKASPHFASANALQAAVKEWEGINGELDLNNKAKAKAKAEYQAADGNEPALVRRWGTHRRSVLAAIEVYADGSKDVAQSFKVEVASRNPAPLAVVPENLRTFTRPRRNAARCRWDATPGATGYMVQHCTNPADPSTISAPIPAGEARFQIDGLAPATTIYFRVAALDASLPGGQTSYTGWLAVVVT